MRWRLSRVAQALGLALALIVAPAAMAQTAPDDAAQTESAAAEAGVDGADSGVAAEAGADLSAGIGVIEAPTGAAKAAPTGVFSLAPGSSAPAAPTRARRSILGAPPVVVELFTAQGCSSCPPADRLIAGLADAPGVLALTWHVDYWDYLGWKDGFASPAHTARQEGYAAVAGERGVYTPQIIVDGHDTLLGLGRAALQSLIEEHASRPSAVMLTATEEGAAHVIQLTPRAAIPGGVEVTLIRFLPRRSVQVGAGENRGMRLEYRNVVVGAEVLTHWPARAPLRLTIRAGVDTDDRFPDDTSHALLVQQALGAGRPGSILAAVRLD